MTAQLPDRQELVDRLAELISQIDRTPADETVGRAPALFAIEVEGYRVLARSDPAGADALCDEVVRRLDRLVRSTDVVGRVDEDRYVLLAGAVVPETAGSIVDRLRSAFAMPLEVAGSLVSIPVRTAVELWSGDHPDPATAAEAMMQRAEEQLAAP